MLEWTARLASRRSRLIVVAALLAGLAAGALGGSVSSRLGPYNAKDPASESFKASKRLHQSTRSDNPVIVALLRSRSPVASPAGRARIAEVARRLGADPGIAAVTTPFRGGSRAMISRDGRSAFAVGALKPSADSTKTVDRVSRAFRGMPDVQLGGGAVAERAANRIVSQDLARAELIAFPILFLLALWFFRSLVAAALPPLMGGLAIVITFLGLRLMNEAVHLSVFALNLVTGLGLGLAIDYSLFVVSRYREEAAKDGAGQAALVRTMRTAGRTVLFSSMTVAAALASLLVFPQNFLYSMGVGGAMVAVVAAGIALVVLPAILALLGDRVNALAPRRLRRAAETDARPDASGAWYRLSRFILRRPGRVAIAATAAMLLMGAPFLRVSFTTVDASILPRSEQARRVSDTVARDYALDVANPITIAAAAPGARAANALAARARALPDVRAVEQPRPVGARLWRIDVVPAKVPLSAASERVVHRIRAFREPYYLGVSGQTAGFVDQKASLGHHLPLVLTILAVTTFAILFAFTGSVVLPVKALAMNLLTLSAAFGLLVLVFQDGRFQGLLGYTSQGALESSQPLVLLALAFGLSTDYGVFLLSRIKEAHDRGLPSSEAVAVGLERTGRIVTAAALLFCTAVGAFATSRIVFIKELGLGTAAAVLIDATIVRALLVPSLMGLLGRWNWWAPRPLRRLHERFALSEQPPATPIAASGSR
jgi:uncharacterized membrane protein YdfJ with MMPL/SSD domain